MERRSAVKIIRRKNKNGTHIDATAKGADGASVEVSHPKWVNAVSQSKSGSTGLILQNGTKLENEFKARKHKVEFASGLTLETEIVQSARNWRGLFIAGNGNRAFAADFGRKLYSSTDSGETWTAL
jgi:hypothetical protein